MLSASQADICQTYFTGLKLHIGPYKFKQFSENGTRAAVKERNKNARTRPAAHLRLLDAAL